MSREIAIVVAAALFLPEQQVDFIELVRSKAEAGCRIRAMLADPGNPKRVERGAEERFGTGIGSRAELVAAALLSLRDVPGIEVHTHKLVRRAARALEQCQVCSQPNGYT